jgi:glc operon protein GlcG
MINLFLGEKPVTIRSAFLLCTLIVMLMDGATSSALAQQPSAPPPQVAYGAPINLDQAKAVMTAAETEAKKNNWNVVIAVLDSGGHVVMLHRLDGAQLGSLEAAKDKAYSAVLFRRPTKAFQDTLSKNLRILKLTGANPIEGGIPLIIDGKLIGAIGVSGVLSEQDAQIAGAGANALR